MKLGIKTTGGVSKLKTKTTDGVTKAVECACCVNFQLTVKYSWEGTGKEDLDTNTIAFGESAGWSCGEGGQYVQWITGDNTNADAFEQVDIRVGDALSDGLWTSSYNIECKAGWFESAEGSGPAEIIVKYKTKTKTKTIYPGSQSDCASTSVATITVYSSAQSDGSYFEIL